MRHTRLLNYARYQVGWGVCVLGAAWHRPWAGFLIAVVLLGVHLALSVERAVEVRLLVLATLVGTAMEIVQIGAGTFGLTSASTTGLLPPAWLLAMWALHRLDSRPCRVLGGCATGDGGRRAPDCFVRLGLPWTV